MNSIYFLFGVFIIQILNNFCEANPLFTTGINADSSIFQQPPPAQFDQTAAYFELSGENAIKNADQLKNYLKELQRYVALMGKPRFGRDLTHDPEYQRLVYKEKKIRKNNLLRSQAESKYYE